MSQPDDLTLGDASARRQLALAKVLDTFDLRESPVRPSDQSNWTSFETHTTGKGRLYGGTTFAIAFLAAARTVASGRRLHSISGTFLRAGRSTIPLLCDAKTLRDGRSFSHRRIRVRQGSAALFEGSASFRAPLAEVGSKRTGIGHSVAKPPASVPSPEECLDREQTRTKELGAEWLEHPVNAVEVRVTDPRHLTPEVKLPPRAINWVRIEGSEGLAATIQTALLLYASDRSLLSTAALPHGILWSRSQAVTLNHSVWLHRPVDLETWHLFVAEGRIAVDGLAVIHLEVFNSDGAIVATAVQEALVQY